MKISTKFEVDTTIRCLVITFWLLIRYVTLWPWPLTFWPWSVVVHGGSSGQPLYQVWRSYGYPLELWVLTFPIGYHWQCVCSHCSACAVLRDLCVRGQFSHIFEISDPDFSIHYPTFMALWWRLSGGASLSTPNVNAVFREQIFKYRWHRSQNGGLGEKEV